MQARHYLLEVTVLEGFKLIPEDQYGVFYGRSALFVLQLDEEAFPQVTGAYSGGFELLYNVQHPLHFFGR